MRFLIVIAALFMIPAFAVVMEWRFQSGQRQDLLSLCRARLAKAGYEQVTVSLDHFDAQVSGICTDPADREKAQALVTGVRGLRVNPEDNRIRVPAKLTAGIQATELHLSGWLPSERLRAEIVSLVRDSRPDLEVIDKNIRISPHVDLGLEVRTQDGSQPKVFVSLLESIQLPASLSISGDGHHYVIKGSLPSAEQRDAILAAVTQSAPNVEIDASQFIAQTHVAAAPFATGSALVDFVRIYFESPTPGTFQIDQRNGPRLKAYATTAMESAWLTALRAVSGGAKVTAEITRVPSLYHFPNCQPQTVLDPPVAEGLREAFRSQPVLFDSGSSRIKAPEEAKIANLAASIKSVGTEVHLIVAGYADVVGEPGTAGKNLQRMRAEAVRAKLIEQGIAADFLEVLPLDAVPPSGPLTDEVRRDTRSVELLIK